MPQTTTVQFLNSTGGNARFTISHLHSTAPVQTWTTELDPDLDPTDPVYHFEVTTLDDSPHYFFIEAVVRNGNNAGIYLTPGSAKAPVNTNGFVFQDPDNKTPLISCDSANMTFLFQLTGHTNTPPVATIPMAKAGPYPGLPQAVNIGSNMIKNVFVLMLENRSFDHIFAQSNIRGALPTPPLANGATGDPVPTAINAADIYQQNSAADKSYFVNGAPMGFCSPSKGPGHEFADVMQQLAGPGVTNPFTKDNNNVAYPACRMNGFAYNYAAQLGVTTPDDRIGEIMREMDWDDRTDLPQPVIWQLARQFAVCDNWFSSVPGPTWPNRFFALCASSAGLDDSPSNVWDVGPAQTFGSYVFDFGSIFDRLKAKTCSSRLYNDSENLFVSGHPFGLGQIPITTAISGVKHSDVHPFSQFVTDVQDTYPYQFTFIEPHYGSPVLSDYKGGSSQHPTDGLEAGERLIAATYNALRSSPLWETCLLIITYDEHGGFYDHVAPLTMANPGDPKSRVGTDNYFNFRQLGPRVPAVIVSPLIPQGTIDHTLYDHTAILKTLEDLNGLGHLTQRDLSSNNLFKLLSLERPRQDCPPNYSATPMTPPTEAELEPRRAILASLPESIDPLPETGNIHGFLRSAAKLEVELGEDTPENVREKVSQIKTHGEAVAYIESVLRRAESKKAGKVR